MSLAKALLHIPQRMDVNPSEISHPTDLIATSPYYELTYLLLLLKVLPEDVHLITSRYWDGYGCE